MIMKKWIWLSFFIFIFAKAALFAQLPKPHADYRLDGCEWNGTPGEVIDSSNGYNGRAVNVNPESNESVGGLICRVADFTKKGTDDYIVLDNRAMDGLIDFTITTWVKTTQSYGIPLLSGANKTGNKKYDNEVLLWGQENKNQIKIHLHNEFEKLFDLNYSIRDGKWHFVAWSREGENNCVYADRDLIGCVNFNYTDPVKIDPGGLILGQEQDSVGGGYDEDQALDGYQDEVKIFKEALEADQIEEIYNNEKNRKNYNGTERACLFDGTITPVEFEGGEVELKNTYADPSWTHVEFNKSFSTIPVVFMVIDSRGGDPASVRIKNVTKTGFDATLVEPQGEDGPHVSQKLNYFAINKGVHRLGDHYVEVGTIETSMVQGRFLDPHQNRIGWQRIDTAVKFCNPAVVANIQTLNNEKHDIPKDTSAPWMTAVLDVNGSIISAALDASETWEGYPLQREETIGYMIAQSNFTDSFVDDYGKRIFYETIKTGRYFVGWSDGCKTVTFQNSYGKEPLIAGWKDSRYGYDGGWFRKCFHSEKKVGFKVDEDRAYDRERRHTTEVGSVFAFSDFFHYTEQPAAKSGIFNAVDSTGVDGLCDAESDWDNNITTKVVSRDFDLYILSKERDTNLSMEANITKIELYFYHSGGSSECTGPISGKKVLCSDNSGTPCPDTDSRGCVKLDSVRIDTAKRCVKVHIEGRDKNSPLNLSEESNSSDNFAIRPKEFSVSPAGGSIYAGEDFKLGFKALDESGGAAKDYNESRGVSFDVNATPLHTGCKEGVWNIENFSFTDGEADDVNASYTEVGEINITIYEINGSEYAKVDQDDTPDNVRLINEGSVTVKVAPYEINITGVEFINSFGEDWLYMSEETNDTNVTLKITLGAFAKTGEKTEDYNDSCFGDENVTVTFYYDVDNRSEYNGSEIGVVYKDIFNSGVEGYEILDEINVSYKIPTKAFSKGEANSSYAFVVDRNFSRPVSPINIKLTEISPSSSSAKQHNPASGAGQISADMNTTFYFGRLRPKDLATTKVKDATYATILVYDKNGSGYVSDLNQTLLHWFIMKDHNSENYGKIKKTGSYKDTVMSQPADMISNPHSPKEGIVEINVTKQNDNFGYIHLDISKWLWFSYDEEAYYKFENSSCIHHPCIKYIYKPPTVNQIKSGEIEGVGFEQNISAPKPGVKVFR